MDSQPGTGAPAESPTAPDFTTFARDADARDLGQTPADAGPPESSPAPSGDQSASTEVSSSAASEPAKPADQKPPKNADSRIQELLADRAAERAENARLREELARTKRPADAPPASEPAQPASKAEYQRYVSHPNAPKETDFDDYSHFVAAMGAFIADQRFEERESRARLDAESSARVKTVEQTIQSFQTRLDEARTADPTFESKVDPGLLRVIPAFALRPNEPVQPHNVAAQAMVESEASNALMLHFSTPEGQKEWGQLCASQTPAAMLRAFGRIEARFLATGKVAGDTPPAKTVTSAPAPPTTLGTKPPSSPDRARAALAAGDFRAYQAAADAADLAVPRR